MVRICVKPWGAGSTNFLPCTENCAREDVAMHLVLWHSWAEHGLVKLAMKNVNGLQSSNSKYCRDATG